MYPVISFTLFKRVATISLYKLFYSIAFGAAFTLVYIRFKQHDIKKPNIILLSAIIFTTGIFGARLLHYITELIRISKISESRGFNTLNIISKGTTFYGGFILAIISIFLVCRFKLKKISKILDIFAPSVAIGNAIGKIGCFMQGCCRGIETNLPVGIKFPDTEINVYPVQLYESLISILIFIFLINIEKKERYTGELFIDFLLMFSFYKFFIHFIRDDERIILGLAIQQVISIFLFCVSLIAKIIFKLRKKYYA